MDGTATVNVFDETSPPEADVVRAVRRACEETGFVTGDGEPVSESDLEPNEKGNLTLYWDKPESYASKQVRCTLGSSGIRGEDVVDVLALRTSAANLVPDSTGNRYTGFPRVFVDLIRRLVHELDPVYVSSHSTQLAREGLSPETVFPIPRLTDVERLPWLGVYGAALVEQFGGRERVLQTPAWTVEELANGSILIVQTREPWDGYRDRQPADRYLLDGEDCEAASSGADQSPLRDPFVALDPGDFGADVAVYRDDIAEEFVDEDLELVRVHVDENGDLRRISDDSFVRNVADVGLADDEALVGSMLDDVPSDAARDEQMVSALVSESIPPEFVRLDGPDDENVVTRVMALDVETNRRDLLISIARAANQDGLDDSTIGTVEQALDKIAQLDDVDGVDRWIEQNLL